MLGLIYVFVLFLISLEPREYLEQGRPSINVYIRPSHGESREIVQKRTLETHHRVYRFAPEYKFSWSDGFKPSSHDWLQILKIQEHALHGRKLPLQLSGHAPSLGLLRRLYPETLNLDVSPGHINCAKPRPIRTCWRETQASCKSNLRLRQLTCLLSGGSHSLIVNLNQL